MAENILTPQFRGAFVQLFKARGMKQADGSMGAAKFSIKAAFPADSNLAEMKKEAEQVAKEKWGDKMPKTLRSPFRLNEELDNPIEGIPDDWVVMTFSAAEDRRPGLVNAKLDDIIDEVEAYSGAWYRAQVRAYAYEQAGNKGVSFGLQNVQKMKDDEPLGKSKVPASKAFTAIEGGSKTAAGVFD
jgi:hypothetical protein